MSEVSLCDLVVLCVIRTIMHALFRLRDQYLVYNCFAVLLNLAPLISNTHSYAAERLVVVMSRLCKRLVKIKEGGAVSGADLSGTSEHLMSTSQHSAVNSNTSSSGVPVDSLEETVRVFFKAVTAAIRPSKRASNIYIVYALIHEAETLQKLLRHPEIIRVVEDDTGKFLNSIYFHFCVSYVSSYENMKFCELKP